jgi:hypothetical protein
MKDPLDAGNSIGMLRQGIIRALKANSKVFGKFMSTTYKETGRKKDLPGMLGVISSMYVRRGMIYTKTFLKNEYNFTDIEINQGLVWDPDTKTVHIRGSLKDTLDYEFYGVPKGTWPIPAKLKKWVKTRVIRRDPMLQREWSQSSRKGKNNMADQLTFLFGRAIARDGLKRRSTTKFEKTKDPKLLEQGISVVYKGNKVTTRQLTQEESLGKYLPKLGIGWHNPNRSWTKGQAKDWRNK